MTKSITANIPDELHERMKEYPEVNWSAVTREAIENYIQMRKRIEKV